MSTASTSIVICDANQFFREGLKSLLLNEVGFLIAAEGNNAGVVISLLEEIEQADVLLIDRITNEALDDRLVTTIKKRFPLLKIIILSTNDSQTEVFKAFKLGVDGYLLKNASSEELIFAIKQVVNNGVYVCSALMKHFLTKFATLSDSLPAVTTTMPNFTGREIEILTLISQGYTNHQISEMLFTSRRTVENYRQGLIDKTGSRNIVSLVRFAILNGLIP